MKKKSKVRSKEIRRAQEIVRKIEPLLVGQGREVQGIALADLTATWLAGHHPAVRDEMFSIHMAVVRDLIKENEKEIFGLAGFPTAGLS